MEELRAATSHQFEYILAGTFAPENIDRVVEDLASHGFNAVQVCVRAPGVHYYPSDIGPVHPRCRDYDFLGDFVAKAHRAGLQIHSYYPVFLEGDAEGVSAAAGQELDAARRARRLGGALADHPTWACLGGKRGELRWDNWGCPSNDEYVDYVVRLVREQVGRYALDAIVWDFLRFRFPCYCAHCREKFRAFAGEDLNTRWPSPAEVDCRCQTVLADLDLLNAAARAARPGIRIGAYVFPQRRAAIAGVFQDWLAFSLRCDFVQPMDYGQIPRQRLLDTLRTDVQLARCPLILGLLPSLGPGVPRGTIEALCEDIQTARQAGCRGFFLLSYEPLFGWPAAGTYSGPYWHTPHPVGAARRLADAVLSEPATVPF